MHNLHEQHVLGTYFNCQLDDMASETKIRQVIPSKLIFDLIVSFSHKY